MQTARSALCSLSNEISWEGNARKYRHGGPGLENVLTVEVFQALDFLPRTEFLGRIIQSADGGTPATLKTLAEQVEDLTVSLADSGEGERSFRREAERYSGLKPNTFRSTPERCSPSSRNGKVVDAGHFAGKRS